MVCDDDSDPYNTVRDWWNTGGRSYATPREHLFQTLGVDRTTTENLAAGKSASIGKGRVIWHRQNPTHLATTAEGDRHWTALVREATARSRAKWRETNYLLLRRGPYVIASGLDESIDAASKQLRGRFVNLFDPDLRLEKQVSLAPGTRWFLLDLDAVQAGPAKTLASACKTLPIGQDSKSLTLAVEGVGNTPAVVLLHSPKPPRSVTLDGQLIDKTEYAAAEKLLWVRFQNQARPRELRLAF
jgi:hypothetical protein